MSDWYYALNNEQKGPVSETVLKVQLTSGKLNAETLVWKEGMANWTPAGQVPEFAPPPPAFAKLSASPEVTVSAATGVNNPSSTTPVTVASLMGPGEALEVEPEDAENNKIFGIVAYLGIFCLVPIFAAKNSPFAKYHANQGLVLFLLEIVLWVVLSIISLIPGIGFLSVILGLAWLGIVVLLIIGVINAAAGKCVPLPVIGKFKLLK